jgi:hypothetical protein
MAEPDEKAAPEQIAAAEQSAAPEQTAVVKQTAAVGETLPDPSVSVTEMNEYGYTAAELLPLSQARAIELYDADNAVFLLYPNNTEAMALDREEITRHEGLFGIEKPDWEKILAANERESERSLEAYFFGNESTSGPSTVLANTLPPVTTHTNMYAIYQVRDDVENARDMRFVSLAELEKSGLEPDRGNYKLVYAAPFSDRIEYTTDKQPVLNRLYKQFNTDLPADFKGQSMSMSDVVVLRCNGDMSAHYVDRTGFTEIGRIEFYGGPPDNGTQERASGQTPGQAGQTFYQVDKRPGDTPTVAELEADVNAGKTISLLDLANAVQAEKKSPPKQKGRPDFLAKIEANKRRAAQASQPAAQKTAQREVE